VSPRRLIRREWHADFWRRPVPTWAVAVIVVGMIVGFAIGLSENSRTARDANHANRGLIAEVAARQHDTCVAANRSRQVLRDVVQKAYTPRMPATAPPDPLLKDPEVIAYIQRLLNAPGSDPSARDGVLAAIPPDSNCTTVVRH
jgi:hypothetical protein